MRSALFFAARLARLHGVSRSRVVGARSVLLLLAIVAGCHPQGVAEAPGATPAQAAALPPVARDQLRPVAAFASLAEGPPRSRALFVEATRVLLHPRCVNCHVSGDSPAQGMAFENHEPPVVRGPDDRGVVGMQCESCHQDRNLALARVPGAPGWRLAPLGMAWIDKGASELCEQLKDGDRNGHRSLDEIVSHSGHDALVGWGWEPGADREAAPGTQQEFGALMAAWVSNGAECPEAVQDQASPGAAEEK
jgi:hypothetical protein